MLFPHKNKNPAARITSKRQDFLTKKGISTANPSYVPRKLFFLISCIYYTRFSGIRKFLPDFFSKTKAPDFFQGKMHFSSQIFQFFTNYFFRILIIFCFRIKIQLLRIQKSSRLPRLLRYHLLFSRHPRASIFLPHQRNRTGFQSTCSSFRFSRSGVF